MDNPLMTGAEFHSLIHLSPSEVNHRLYNKNDTPLMKQATYGVTQSSPYSPGFSLNAECRTPNNPTTSNKNPENNFYLYSRGKRDPNKELKRRFVNRQKTSTTPKRQAEGRKIPSTHSQQARQQEETLQINLFDTRQLLEKIDGIVYLLKGVEKRVSKLESVQSYSDAFLKQNSMNSINTEPSSQELTKIKNEINTMKEDLKNTLKWEELEKVSEAVEVHSENKIKNWIDERVSNITKQMSQMEEVIEKKRSNVLEVMNQEERKNSWNLPSTVKSSGIRCSGSAILLRFIESFKVRTNNTKKNELKLTLTDNTYYIDSQGYLLDKDQFYLTNNSGQKLKLQPHHITLLQENQILQ